jgi:hypothetical protein
MPHISVVGPFGADSEINAPTKLPAEPWKEVPYVLDNEMQIRIGITNGAIVSKERQNRVQGLNSAYPFVNDVLSPELVYDFGKRVHNSAVRLLPEGIMSAKSSTM